MNNDTPDIKQAISEAIDSSTTNEQPNEESKVVDQQLEINQEEAEEKKEVVEEFAEKGDLSGKTPEELEEIYTNWQRAYTEKRQRETQELKRIQKELEELKSQKTNKPQQVQEEQTRSVSQIQKEMGTAQQDVQLGKMSVQEYTEYMRNLIAEESRQIAREEYQTLSAQQQEEHYQEQLYQEFVSADNKGRLDENSPNADEPLIKEVKDFLAQELQKHIDEHGTSKGFKSGDLARQKVQEYDTRLDEIIKKRTQQSTQLANARAVKAQKSSTRGTNANSKPVNGNSIRDILMEAVED